MQVTFSSGGKARYTACHPVDMLCNASVVCRGVQTALRSALGMVATQAPARTQSVSGSATRIVRNNYHSTSRSGAAASFWGALKKYTAALESPTVAAESLHSLQPTAQRSTFSVSAPATHTASSFSHSMQPHAANKPVTRGLSSGEVGTSQIGTNYNIEKITRELVNPSVVHDHYIIKEELGNGAFGWVVKAECKATGEACAIKVQEIDENPWCFRELEMTSLVNHPNCMKVLDAFIHKGKLLIVTPYYSGSDLYDYIVEMSQVKDFFSEQRAFELCADMLTGLEACHRAGFAHLDVKPENFMFQHSGAGSPLILVDFGSAEPFQKAKYAESSAVYMPDADDTLTTLSRITGTACYMSPEVANGSFSSRSDVWSTGTVMYILMAGEPPFELTRTSSDPNDMTPRFDISPNLRHPQIASMTENGRDIMMNMLHSDPAQRRSATEVLAEVRRHLVTISGASY